MINGTRVNVISPRIDTKCFEKRFPFFNYNEKYIDKIFYYNSAGIVVNDAWQEHKAEKIYNYKIFFLIPIYIFSYISLYREIARIFKPNFLADLIFYVSCRRTVLNNDAVYIRIFEFNKYDYIFNFIIEKYNIKTIYLLHTLKSINTLTLRFVDIISKNKNILIFLAPSLYHKKILESKFNMLRVENYKYVGHARVSVGKKLIYKKNSNYILILNGSDIDSKLIDLAIQKYGLNILIRPHPLVEFKHNMRIFDGSICEVEGVLYNSSSAVLLSEYINVPKYFIDLDDGCYDILNNESYIQDITTYINNQKKYIKELFDVSQSDDVYKIIEEVLYDSDSIK